MAKLDSQIRLSLDPEPALSALKKFSDKWSGTMTGLNQGLELVAKAWSGIDRFVIEPLINMSKMASAAEKAQLGLAASLRQYGEDAVKLMPAINNLNAVLQRQTGIGDEDIIQLQEKLLALGVLPGELDKATKATLGYASATGKDAKGAAEQIAKAWRDGESALKGMGVTLRNGEDVREKLTSFYSVAEQKGRTLETRVAALSQVFGDFQEQLGRLVNESAGGEQGRGLLDSVTTFFEDTNTILGEQSGREIWLPWGFRTYLEGWKLLGDTVHDAAQEVRDAQDVISFEDASKLGVGGSGTVDFTDDEAGTIEGDRDKEVERRRRAAEARKRQADKDEAEFVAEIEKMFDLRNAAQTRELRQQELHIERMATRDEWALEAKRARAEREEKDQEAHDKRMKELAEEKEKFLEAHTFKLGSYVMQAANFGLETAGALLAGEQSAGDAAKSFFGSLLGIVGRELITLGGAAIGLSTLMETLGIPIVGAAAGVAAIAIGATLVAGGSALRSSAARDAHSTVTTGVSAPASYYTPPSASASGFTQTAQPTSVTYEIHFGAIVSGRTQAEVGREMQRYLRAAEAAAGGR